MPAFHPETSEYREDIVPGRYAQIFTSRFYSGGPHTERSLLPGLCMKSFINKVALGRCEIPEASQPCIIRVFRIDEKVYQIKVVPSEI